MSPLFGRGDEGRERSAADREAARLERERRRALREGRPPPDELPGSDDPRAPAESAGDDPPAPVESAGDDARAAVEPAGDDPPAPVEPAGDDPRAAVEPAGDEPEGSAPSDEPARGGRESSWEPFASEPDPEPTAASHREPIDRRRGRGPDPLDPELDPDPPAQDADPQATQPLEPVGAPRARRTVSLPHPQTEELGHHTESWDRPIGTVRRSRAEYQAQPGAPGMPPHRNLPVR